MEDLFNTRAYVVVSIILVGIGAFLLGGLAVYSLYSPQKLGDRGVTLTPLESDNPVTIERRVYASRSGKRYYPWWCDTGRRSIKPANIVWYDSPEKAREAGYSIAKSCDK